MDLICANPRCGKSFVFRGGKAHFDRRKRHFCCLPCVSVTHGLAGTPRHRIWEGAKKRAKENGTVFSLTVRDIPEIPVECPVLGIKIIANTKAGPLDSSPSMDRIKPELGYTPGNVRIISNRANRLRSDANASELYLVARDAEFLEKQT